METIAVYVVHDLEATTQEPMAFPTYENAEAYAMNEVGENYFIYTVPVVRYATQLLPVDILMRPTASALQEGQVQEGAPMADGADNGALPQ